MSMQSETSGEFNFLTKSVESSLYRNGKVLIRRDADGSDSGREGLDFEKQPLSVINARASADKDRPGLIRNGFELFDAPFTNTKLDFLDHQQVVEHYYAECEAIMQQATGGRAYAFDHNVRSAAGKQSKQRIKGGQQVQGPAHTVHGDYTLTSAPQRLRDLARPPSGNDTLRYKLSQEQSLLDAEEINALLENNQRFAIINVWRNIVIEPVVMHPLALCDGKTVAPEDLVVFEIHYPDRIGENYFARHSNKQQMFYYPLMTRDEALLIKQWDSAGPLATSKGELADNSSDEPCTFSFHSAFKCPDTPEDAPDRWSVEVRCIVIY
ncbi:MAG: hypothetical protein ACI8P9_003651 [Parasphingorhabdus sp.]|jgi:hypothetical protein